MHFHLKLVGVVEAEVDLLLIQEVAEAAEAAALLLRADQDLAEEAGEEVEVRKVHRLYSDDQVLKEAVGAGVVPVEDHLHES